MSVRTGEGIEALVEAVAASVGARGDEAWVGLARHAACTEEAAGAVSRAIEQLRGEALELAAFELGAAEARLSAITGRPRLGPIGDEVLDAIFSSFCIGK